MELVREGDLRAAGGVGELVDAAGAAPAVLAAAALFDGALGPHALDDRDRDPRVPARALGPHARARADAGRALLSERPVDEEVVGERLVAGEVVEEVEHQLARPADRRADGDGGHGRTPFGQWREAAGRRRSVTAKPSSVIATPAPMQATEWLPVARTARKITGAHASASSLVNGRSAVRARTMDTAKANPQCSDGIAASGL